MNNNRLVVCAVVLGAMCLAANALAQVTAAASSANPRRSKLQITDLGGIREWRIGGPNLVYIQGDAGRWYRVDLQEACMKLDTSKGVQFITETDEGGRYSAVDVANRQCRITTITKIQAPPL